jgi:hypothetical protein
VGTPRPLLAPLSCALVALAGCGANDRPDDVAAVAERFGAALEREDGVAACAELRETTASALEQQQGEPCEQAILRLELPSGGSAAGTSVYVTDASVVLAEGSTTFLDEGSDGWKVTAAGCRPAAPELPYECELED